MKFIIMDTKEQIDLAVADILEAELRKHPTGVFGFATGSSPKGVYEELIRRHKEDGLDFSGITTINLDEYVGLDMSHKESYHSFMNQYLFDHVNVDRRNVHIPDGGVKDPEAEALRFEALINEVEPAAVQILGVGVNGHIGFNEPADCFTLPTHVTELTQQTIEVNSRFFDSVEEVPHQAITMGVGGIMRAKKIVFIATGKAKQEAVKALEHGSVTPANPSTILKVHPDVTVFCDREAAALLKLEDLKRID